MNRRPLVTGEVYHLYNRGVDKRKIFLDDSYYSRFMSMVRHYLSYDYPYSTLLRRRRKHNDVQRFTLDIERYRWREAPIEIFGLCLMPNHFHFQVKQLADHGISNFMHRLGTGYTNYFNIRHERTGSLFQGAFRSVRIESEGQFLCLHRYIHINPASAGLVNLKNLALWQWSSLPEYLSARKDKICNTKEIFHYFNGIDDYLDFILADFKDGEREDIEKLVIDDDFGWFEEEQDRSRRLRRRLMASYAHG